MEQNGQRGGVGREDDQLGSTAIEGLGGCSKVSTGTTRYDMQNAASSGWDHLTLVRTLLQLAVVRSLLHQVQELLGESLIGQGPGYQTYIN